MNYSRQSHGESGLFRGLELREVMEGRFGEIKAEVEKVESGRLLNTAPEDLATYLVDKYRLEPIVLHSDRGTLDQREEKLDVSGDPSRRFFSDHRRGPLLVDATRFDLHVPFSGDAELFNYIPNQRLLTNFPGTVQSASLTISHVIEGFDTEAVNRHFDNALQNINTMLSHSASMVREFNGQLQPRAMGAITARRERLLKASGMASGLKFPIRRRDGMAGTYVVPSVQKRIVPVLPSAPAESFHPEPTIDLATYEEILRSLRSMSLVMERNPTPFRELDEEGIRTHFLVALNATFEGEASGETFNGRGKTDILIRHKDQNLFIAECKFWKGPKKFGEAVDQLLGYVTWRDTKTALLVFNRGRETSAILATIQDAIKGHARFKRLEKSSPHGNLRAILGQERDPNREVVVEVQVFDVPSPEQP